MAKGEMNQHELICDMHKQVLKCVAEQKIVTTTINCMYFVFHFNMIISFSYWHLLKF